MPVTFFSRRIRWVLTFSLFFMATFAIARILFYLNFHPQGKINVLSAYWLGARYDAKFVSMLAALVFIFTSFSSFDPFERKSARRFWNIFIIAAWLLCVFIFAADYFHYDYLQQRLNASVLNYLDDASISFGMMMESYPVFKFLAGLVILALLANWIVRRIFHFYESVVPVRQSGRWINCTFLLLLAFLIYGKAGQYPLRWSDAFNLRDNFSANLALNPFQSFFSSLRFRNSTYDLEKVKKYYPLMANQLGVSAYDPNSLNYDRAFFPADSSRQKMNVVVVICESFSAYKSSAFGNPLNTTPFFDKMCREGVFFDRCFTPSYGTARGVWAVITGIPDVESPKTASRNPAAVEQRTLINDFKGYEHMYFIGGNPAWANIQGLLSNNIEDLRLYMQYDFKTPKLNVWGISDKDLFLETNSLLSKESNPFVAIIQTADNHRPYSIPEEDAREIGLLRYSKDSLRQFGFQSNEELNAFRYTDHCFKKFMEAAQKEKYFQNTLFVFVGDHGIPGDAGAMFPKSWTNNRLTTEHVPLLFYSPGHLSPSRERRICSQLDVLPSAAALAGIPYVNHAMGRNLFDSSTRANPYAFIVDHDHRRIGFIRDGLFYSKGKDGFKANEEWVSILDDNLPAPEKQNSKVEMATLTDAWYETAKYLLVNNRRKSVTVP